MTATLGAERLDRRLKSEIEIMRELFSIAELSKILNISVRALTRRANNEEWEFKTNSGRGKNGKRRVYCLQGLPRDVQRKIISQQIGCDPDFIPSKNLDISHAEAGLKKWNEGDEYNQKTGIVRKHILKSANKFIKDRGLKQVQGKERFAALYNAGLIKNIDPWVYEEIDHVSRQTLERWVRKEKKGGVPGLLGKRGNRKGQGKAITSEQSAFIISHIKAKPHIRPEHIFKIVCKTFETHPSRRTVCRFVNEWKEKNPQLFALIEDPRRWKNHYMPAFGDASADVSHFGHTWEPDSTPADIITIDGKRLAVIGVFDVFSRRTIVLIAPTSKSIAIAAAIRKALIAWGVPARIRMDNGADYQSFHIQAITSALKIKTPELPKYAPEKKPFIERFFGTYARGFEELLPGYCGHSVKERQALREKETWAERIMKPGGIVEVPLTMEEFQALTDRWVELYERTPHKGLDGKTPIEVAKKSTLQPEKIRDERILDILLAPVARRTVQKKGISIDGSFFTSPELIDYIGQSVEIKRDLYNAGLLYVFDASEKYLCQAKNEPLTGQDLEDYLRAKKKHFKGLKELSKALDRIGSSNRTPLEILLEDNAVENDESKVIPFQGNFVNQAVREAEKAVSDTETELPDTLEPIQKAVNYNHLSSDHLIDNSYMTEEDYDREFEEMKKYPKGKNNPN